MTAHRDTTHGIRVLEQMVDVLASDETTRAIARIVTARHLELARTLIPDHWPEFIAALEQELLS